MKGAWVWIALGCLFGLAGEASAGAGYPFEFKAGSPHAALGPRFQPMSSSVALRTATRAPAEGLAHCEGFLPVGPPGSKPRRLVVSRTKAGEAFDRLFIDLDGDGSLDDETPIEARLQSSGRTVWSTFKVVLRVNHGSAARPQIEEHPFRTWLAVAGKTTAPDAFHYTSQGFRLGRVTIEGLAYDVVLSDRNNDGRYGAGDAWTVRSSEQPGPPQAGDAFGLHQAVSAGGRRWRLLLDGTGGRRGRIVPEGEAPEAAPREPDADGAPAAPLADAPLEFAETFEEAQKRAAKTQGPLLLSFESQASTASRALRERVYAARAVVDAAEGLACARIDLDANRGLKARFEVKDAPTGILLDPDGKEVARFSGSTSVEAFLSFLGAVHPWLRPADDEPKLGGKARKRHEKEVKRLVAYLQDNSHQGLLVDRIKDLGSRKHRSARDALMGFAARRKSKEYIAEAFFALAVIGGRVGIEFLCGPKALRSKDFLVAQQAALALGLAKDARAVAALLDVLLRRGTKIEVVSACCIALAQSAPADARVAKQVFAHSEHGKDTIRAGAAEALGYLKTDAAVERLRTLLQQDKNTRVRGAAARGIGHTQRTELIPLLRKAIAEDKAHTVRTAAHEAIRELQGDKPTAAR